MCLRHTKSFVAVVRSLSHLWLFAPHGPRHTRPPYASLSLRVCSNSYPSSQWCYPTGLFCLPLLLLPSIFPSIRVFPIRWPKYWSFSFIISPSNEYSGLISFRIDWFDLSAIQGTPESLLQAEIWKQIESSSLWSNSHIQTCWKH